MNNTNLKTTPNFFYTETDPIIINIANQLYLEKLEPNGLLENFSKLIGLFEKIRVDKKHQLVYNQKLYYAKKAFEKLQKHTVVNIKTYKKIKQSHEKLFHNMVDNFLWIDEMKK